jgi:hypothetical protein
MNLMQSRIGMIDEQKSIARSWPQTVIAVAQFADCVAERCAPGRMAVSQADLAMACERSAEINLHYGGPQIAIAPSISVAERKERFGEREARALFDRLFTRQTRVSSLQAFAAQKLQTRNMVASPASVRGDGGSSAEPVARVLPKSPVAAIKEESKDSVSLSRIEPGEKDWGTRLSLPVEAKPVVLAAPEVKRVAEQVMQEIQHRVIAQRERVGRR